jgi:hypothetical protein
VSPLFLTLSLRDLSIGFESIQTVWFERPFRLWQIDLRYAIQVVIVSSNRLALIWLSIGSLKIPQHSPTESKQAGKRKAYIVVETCAQNLDIIIMMHVLVVSSRQGSWSMYGSFLDRGEVNFLSNLLVICRDHHRVVLVVLSVLY